MDIHTLSILSALTITGYGEVVDGQPSWSQRELHVYTNWVRVDPQAWADEYPCSFSDFTSEEQSSKAPLYYDAGLTSIAQAHSDDMDSHAFMAHESFDGTDFGTRVWPWYDGTTIGENVAFGYANNWDVVFDGWMCSAGHRSNIMEGAFEDLGTGITGLSYTQDFGGGIGTVHTEVAMGVHSPEVPAHEVEFLATYEDDEALLGLWVETDDDCLGMEPLAGSGARGAYSVSAQASDGCAAYRFGWETGAGIIGTLPQTGAYVYGAGCPEWTADAPTGCTVEEEPDPSEDDESGDTGLQERSDEPSSEERGDCSSDSSCHDEPKAEAATGCSIAPAQPTKILFLIGFGAIMCRVRRGLSSIQ